MSVVAYRSKSSFVSFRLLKTVTRLNHLKLNIKLFHKHNLSDPLTRFYTKHVIRMIKQANMNNSSVVRIDHTHSAIIKLFKKSPDLENILP